MMQRIPFARFRDFTPRHPERTAYRMKGSGLDFDVTVKEFPNRPAMLKTIQMQESGPNWRQAWQDWQSSRYNRKGAERTKMVHVKAYTRNRPR